MQTPFGYGCANYKKDDPESCRFSIGKMGEKTLNEAQVKQLLECRARVVPEPERVRQQGPEQAASGY